MKPAGAIRDEQYVVVDVDATTLLQSSHEHIAISVLADDQPFDSNGRWTARAPGGGIGIAMGRLENAYHPSCPADPNDSMVEFAIERFSWAEPSGLGSQILNCVSFPKSYLNYPTWQIRITVVATCGGTTCNAWAYVTSVATGALFGSVRSDGIPLANPTNARQSWFAVTNFYSEWGLPHSASFWVNGAWYAAYYYY